MIRTLKSVFAKHPRHPYALHLLVHVVEASPHPEMGDAAADLLRDMAPGLGHLTHMPTHIDIRRGRWQEAVVASEKAVAADSAYRQLAPDPGVYCRILMAHDNHMLAYAAAMQGESQKATQAITDLLVRPARRLRRRAAAKLDAFFAMPYELHLRFGRWDEMLAEPEPSEPGFPIATAFWHFARATAFAAKKDVASAKPEQAAFRGHATGIPEKARFSQEHRRPTCSPSAESMLAGEILYREGEVDEAIARLREAAVREDALQYVEPPEWILPARHVLGATLMDAGRYAEAEAVYREDLKRRPENGWSLFGLWQSPEDAKENRRGGRRRSALQNRLATCRHQADGSCLCLPAKH